MRLESLQGDAKQLIVQWRPFEVSGALPEAADAELQAKVLLERIENLELSYYGAPSRNLPAAWHEQWLEASTLPQLVRIQIGFPPADLRLWPDLIVRPMTDAAPPIF